jgi:hypothetical protein
MSKALILIGVALVTIGLISQVIPNDIPWNFTNCGSSSDPA